MYVYQQNDQNIFFVFENSLQSKYWVKVNEASSFSILAIP